MGFLREYIQNDVLNHNRNFMMIIVGGCGSGKSYAGLYIGKEVDDNFSIQRVVFNPGDFLRLVNSDLPAGSVIIWDEAGVGMSNREWFTISNKLINYVTQTFRHKNLVVIFTVPSFDFIDKHLRELFDMCLVTKKIRRKERVCILKPLSLQNNPQMGKIYQKYKYATAENGRGKVKEVMTGMPDLFMRRLYEIKKRTFTSQLNQKAQLHLDDGEMIMGVKKQVPLTKKQKEVYDLLQRMTVKEVAEKLGIGMNMVYYYRLAIQARGWDI